MFQAVLLPVTYRLDVRTFDLSVHPYSLCLYAFWHFIASSLSIFNLFYTCFCPSFNYSYMHNLDMVLVL